MSQMSVSAPKQCACGRKLERPRYNKRAYPKPANYVLEGTNESWLCSCSCGTVYVWSYPNVWKERHILPLFDRKLTLPQNYDFYGHRLRGP